MGGIGNKKFYINKGWVILTLIYLIATQLEVIHASSTLVILPSSERSSDVAQTTTMVLAPGSAINSEPVSLHPSIKPTPSVTTTSVLQEATITTDNEPNVLKVVSSPSISTDSKVSASTNVVSNDILQEGRTINNESNLLKLVSSPSLSTDKVSVSPIVVSNIAMSMSSTEDHETSNMLQASVSSASSHFSTGHRVSTSATLSNVMVSPIVAVSSSVVFQDSSSSLVDSTSLTMSSTSENTGFVNSPLTRQ